MRRSRHAIVSSGVVISVLLLASLACAMPVAPAQAPAATVVQPQPPTADPGLQQTSIALAVQQTSIAIEKATLQAQSAAQTQQAAAQAQQAAQPPTAVMAAAATQPPTAPPTATAVPPTEAPPATPTQQPSPTAVDMEAKIRGANILVYEDMASYYAKKPLVHQAISEMNFSGGRVIEVGDALGHFKEQLINTTDWDLILVAAEFRTAVQGEFWQYVYDQVNRGAAVAIEVWYLDKHYTDIQPLLNKCGLEFQKNWNRGDQYRISDYAVYWLQPDHPFFQTPQVPVTLGNVNYIYWAPPLTEDAGDLLQLASTGDAVILGGTQPSRKTSYGVLATCLKGTMIVQSFSSHDYKPVEVVNLWKNYIRYTLTNHFNQKK